MNEKSCGTCEYLVEYSNGPGGICWWFAEIKTPVMVPAIVNNRRLVPKKDTWGKDCLFWSEKV